MPSREAWLNAGARALEVEGAPGVKIDKLVAQLGASKGSFYHHFGSARGFKLALLEALETAHTTRFIDAVDATAGEPPAARLGVLLDLVVASHPDDGHHPLEIALRAWAQQDSDVRTAQERIDRVRVDYVASLWRGFGVSADEATIAARMLYALLIGASHTVPTLSSAQLREVYAFALRLQPGSTGAAQ